MSTNTVLGLLGLVGIFHLLIASLATIELKEYPLYSLQRKVIWFIAIWLLPFVGSYWFHKKANIKTVGGNSDYNAGGFSGGDGDGGFS